MKLSLRYKFILPTICLIFFGMGISLTLSFVKSRAAFREIVVQQVTGQTEAASNMLTSWIHERKLNLKNWSQEQVLNLAADDSWIDNFSRNKVNERFMLYKSDYPEFEDL